MPNAHLLAPEQYNMVQEIEKYAHNAEKLALIWESEAGEARQMTYQELINGANKIANVLIEQGLEKGDVVLVMVPRLLEAYQSYLADLKAGLVISPSSEQLRASDIAYRLQHSGAKAVIVYEPFLPAFNRSEEHTSELQSRG